MEKQFYKDFGDSTIPTVRKKFPHRNKKNRKRVKKESFFLFFSETRQIERNRERRKERDREVFES